MGYFLSAFFKAMPTVLSVGGGCPRYISSRKSNFATDRANLANDANKMFSHLQRNAEILERGYIK